MSGINQKEYLKKYMSSGSKKEEKKKRKKKAKSAASRVKIIDDDVEREMFHEAAQEDLLAANEDAPQVVGVYDERPLELRMDHFRTDSVWKQVTIKIEDESGEDESPPRRSKRDEDSPARRKQGNDTSTRRKESSPRPRDDYDESPPRRSNSKREEDSENQSRRSNDGGNLKRRNEDGSSRRNNDDSNLTRSDDDRSPPRRKVHGNLKRKNESSPRRNNYDVNLRRGRNDDASPPRRNIDAANPRRGDDESPTRRSSDYRTLNRKTDEGRRISARTEKHDESPRRSNNDVSHSKNIQSTEDLSTTRRDNDSGKSGRFNEDISPKRRKKRRVGPSRWQENEEVSRVPDLGVVTIKQEITDSPPGRRNCDNDISPPRKRRDEENDGSSRRLQTIDGDFSTIGIKVEEDSSPPRRKRCNEDSTPPRRIKVKDYGPSRRRDDRDNSLLGRKDETDSSPPRRRGTDTSNIPPIREESNNSNSASRGKKNSPLRSVDASQRASNDRSSSKDLDPVLSSHLKPSDRKHRWDDRSTSKKLTKTLDGKSAGLQNSRDLVHETREFKKREDDLFASMPTEVSGANAATVMRDRKTGKIRDLQKEAVVRREKEKGREAVKEKYDKWGKGTKQVEDYNEKLQQDLYEMSKPLARYADDEDLERYLKEQERDGDPMLAYIRKKKRKDAVECGKPLKPQYEGEFAPNRFGIRPGHRWDGVDRSNGYEKKWFEVQNAKQAQREEVYKWNTEDM